MNSNPKFINGGQQILASVKPRYALNSDIFLFELSGEKVRKISSGDGNYLFPSGSEKGHLIFYVEARNIDDPKGSKIWQYDLQSQKNTVLSDSGRMDLFPDHSENTGLVSILRFGELAPEHMSVGTTWRNVSLLILSPTSNRSITVTSNRHRIYDRQFSRSGETLYYSLDSDDLGHRTLFSFSLAGKLLTRIGNYRGSGIQLGRDEDHRIFIETPLDWGGRTSRIVSENVRWKTKDILFESDDWIESFDYAQQSSSLLIITTTGKDRLHLSRHLFHLDLISKKIKQIQLEVR